mgnify:CR=1 FL=1
MFILIYYKLLIINMANNKSALKRIRIGERNRLQNRFYKSNVRKLTKLFYERLEFYKNSQNPDDKQKVYAIVNTLYSTIDKGYKKNVKNTAFWHFCSSHHCNVQTGTPRHNNWTMIPGY